MAIITSEMIKRIRKVFIIFTVLFSFAGMAPEGLSSDKENETVSRPPSRNMPRLRSNGEFILDAYGRVTLLRGANVPAQYYKPFEFDSRNLEVLRSFGFNFIRLGLAWDKAEPEEGEYDMEYLRSIVEFARLAGDYGMYVTPEVHQVAWCSPGSGVPVWMCSEPAKNGLDFAAIFRETGRFWDDPELQDKLIRFWVMIVEQFKDLDNVMGYNPMNEPLDASMLVPGSFEKKLFSFYDRWIEAVREIDPDRPAVLEPCAANLLLPMKTPPFIHDNLVYAPHPYFLHGYTNKGKLVVIERESMYGLSRKYARNAREAGELGAPLLIGEFGGPPQYKFAERWLARSVELQDEYFTGFAVWVYNPPDDNWAIADEHGNPGALYWEVLRRPYPRHTAGEPVRLSYAYKDKRFTFVFKPDHDITAPTEIYLPRELADEVTVSGGHWSYDNVSEVMCVRPRKDRQEIIVEIK
jgi:endoglycosylceramidase